MRKMLEIEAATVDPAERCFVRYEDDVNAASARR